MSTARFPLPLVALLVLALPSLLPTTARRAAAEEAAAPAAGIADAGLPADLPASNRSDRAPGDSVDPDLLPFVIPPGKEEAVKSLFAGLWDTPPEGVAWDQQTGVAIERELVRAKFTVDGKPGQLLLVHPGSEEKAANVVATKGGADQKLRVLGTCDGCAGAQEAKVTQLAEAVLANQARASVELWKFKPKPVSKPKNLEGGSGGPGGAGEGDTVAPPRSPLVRIVRIVGGLLLFGVLVVLIRRRNQGGAPPPSQPPPPA
jgi:hypothetical protein